MRSLRFFHGLPRSPGAPSLRRWPVLASYGPFSLSGDSIRWASACLLSVSLCLLVSGCGERPQPATQQMEAMGKRLQWTGKTMGTTYRIRVDFVGVGALGPERQPRIAQRVEACLERINQQMSTYRADSELSAFNRAAAERWYPVSAATASVVAAALQYHEQTRGAFDVTVGPLMRLWGFGAEAANETADAPDSDEIRAALAKVGSAHLRVRMKPNPALRKLKSGIEVDLSSLAKGYAVDRLVDLLKSEGGTGGLVEIGGEVRTWGKRGDGRRWRIGIENPLMSRRALTRVLRLETAALATSGDYRNFHTLGGWQIAHLIDPRTGKPLTTRQMSVSVCAETCMEADALATALTLMGVEEGLAWSESHGVAAMFLVVENDNIVEKHSSYFDPYLQ